MAKRTAQPKPAHKPAGRKTKPKFDVPADVGEPASASWVYREETPEIPPDTRAPSAAAMLAEVMAAPIATAIEITAALAPEPERASPAEFVAHAPVSKSVEPEPTHAAEAPATVCEQNHERLPHPGSERIEGPVERAFPVRLLSLGVGLAEFVASAAFTLATAPIDMVRRRLMP